MAPTLDIPAVAKAYEARGVSRDTFYHHLNDLLRVRALEIPGLDWSLLDHMLSSVQSLPVRKQLEAFAAGTALEYTDLRSFLEAAVEAGVFPPTVLQTSDLPEVEMVSGDFGRLLVKLGLADKAQVQTAEDIRNRIAMETGVEPAIGCILRSTAQLSVPDFIRALAVFRGIEGDDLDALADAVYDANARRTTLTMRTRRREG